MQGHWSACCRKGAALVLNRCVRGTRGIARVLLVREWVHSELGGELQGEFAVVVVTTASLLLGDVVVLALHLTWRRHAGPELVAWLLRRRSAADVPLPGWSVGGRDLSDEEFLERLHARADNGRRLWLAGSLVGAVALTLVSALAAWSIPSEKDALHLPTLFWLFVWGQGVFLLAYMAFIAVLQERKTREGLALHRREGTGQSQRRDLR